MCTQEKVLMPEWEQSHLHASVQCWHGERGGAGQRGGAVPVCVHMRAQRGCVSARMCESKGVQNGIAIAQLQQSIPHKSLGMHRC
jgi:hypothetical protein